MPKSNKYKHKKVRDSKLFDKRSFRIVDVGREGHTKIVIGCPKGKWNNRDKRCLVGTKVQSIIEEI